MTFNERIISVVLMTLATMITRFLPFIAFPEGKEPPRFITTLSTVLPAAATSMLLIYALRHSFSDLYLFAPSVIALVLVYILHKWKKNMLLSIGGGTAVYMLLIQNIFV